MAEQQAKRPERDPLPRPCGRVILRRLAVTDLTAFQAYRHDPEVGRYQGWSPMPDSQASAFLTEMSAIDLLQPGDWTQIGIARTEDDRLIGDIGLFIALDQSYAEIGFTLSRQSQGQGLATLAVREAIRLVFELTAVDHVIGITDARNQPSIRLLERVGMDWIDSTPALFRGQACTEYTYSVSRPVDG